MHDTPDCRPGTTPDDAFELPTRQKNILRNLLDKPDVLPEEVAKLHYRVVERASGVGRHSLDVIRTWLHRHGLELSGIPLRDQNPQSLRRQRKIESAIGYLKANGYKVTRPR